MDLSALYMLTYGLYIVSSADGQGRSACVVNTVQQVTNDPVRLSVAVAKSNHTHDLIQRTKCFAVSVLTEQTSMDVIRTFGFQSSRNVDKFAGVPHKEDENGVPYLTRDTAARFSVQLEQSLDLGTHTLFVGIAKEAEVLSQESVMTYAYYHQVKKGGAPKAAPSYQPPQSAAAAQKKEEPTMKKYVCQICGYVYDEAEGAPDAGIAPGTKWEDVPDDFVCPICGVDKSNFEAE